MSLLSTLRPFCLLAITFWSLSLVAQSRKFAPTIFRSESFDLPGYSKPLDWIDAKNGTSIFLLFNSRGAKKETNYTLVTTNEDASVITKKVLDLNYEGKQMRFHNAEILGDQLLVLSSFYNEKNKEYFLLARFYDPVTLEPKGTLRPIAQVADLDGKATGYFTTRFSPDHKNLVVQTIYKPKGRKNGSVQLQIFDATLTEVVTLFPPLPPAPGEQLNVGAPLLTNDRHVFIPITEFGKKSARNKNPKPLRIIYHIPPSGAPPARLTYSLDNYQIKGVRFELIGDHKLALAGQFGESRDSWVTLGYFYKTFDLESLTETAEVLVPFAKIKKKYGLISPAEGPGSPTELGKLTRFTSINDLIPAADGSIYLIGAQSYKTEEGGMGDHSYTLSHTRNIVAAHLTPALEVNWLRLIPMHITNGTYAGETEGLAALAKEGHLYLLFNDHPDNRGDYRSSPKAPRVLTRLTNRLVRIGPDGIPADYRVNGEKIPRKNTFYASKSLRDATGNRFVTLIAEGKGSNVLLITQF